MGTYRMVAGVALLCMAAMSASAAELTSQEQLGKSIFFDQNLSINGNQSCATCHDPATGWTGSISGITVYEGSIPGRFGNRKPPSSAYATQSPILHYVETDLFIGGNFWDGRATGERLGSPAAEQALGPFLNPLEQALGSAADVISRICGSGYGGLFQEVCGSETKLACDPVNTNDSYDCIGYSVAAYEASPESNAFTSKFDAYRKGKAKLTPSEHLGYAMFIGKAKCNKCHTLSLGAKGTSLFTDYTYDNLGIPKNPENPFYLAAPEFNPDGLDWIDLGLGGFLESRPDYQPLADANYGKHKVPTLRNVDKRPDAAFDKTFGHNGYFKSLKEIVHFYNTRDVLPTCTPGDPGEKISCWPPPEVPVNVNSSELGNLRLTEAQENALVDFMKTLTDGYNK